MPNIKFNLRRGGGSATEILYGTVELRPTSMFQSGSSLVLPAPTVWDLVNGEATASNVYPTPPPTGNTIEWAYQVKVTDTRGKSFEWLVGVPDVVGTVEFSALPRYTETAPPLYGKGDKGDPGQAATIVVGTTTSGATPAVTNTGTPNNAVLNFVLPKGDTGATGAGVPAGGSALQIIRKNSANSTTEWATLTKALVGLGNVDNTSDADKPVSTAQATAIANATTLTYRAKLAADALSTYPHGVTVFTGTTADGWPDNTGGVADSSRIITFKHPGASDGFQMVTGRTPSNLVGNDLNKILYRTATVSGVWGAWQTLVSETALNTRLDHQIDRVLVDDFGAVGDGVADDTPAIVAAIEYAYSTRAFQTKTVVFSPGKTYNTYSRIRLRGNVNYEATGATFKKNSVSGGYAVFYTRSDGAKGYGSGDSNIRWTGGRFQGSFASNTMICAFALHHTDNAEFSDFVCSETQGTGHTFDLLGCSNIKIHDFEIHGFNNNSTGGYQKSEAIQIDVSAAGSSSGVDSAGSYDGLMTRDVEVWNGLFSSITVGGVFYPAPNPIGSHAMVETQIARNINFHHNHIINPALDTTSGIYGAIHFIGGSNISIVDNLFEYTSAAPNNSTTMIGLYSTNWGTPWTGSSWESGASNTPRVLTTPMVISDVLIARNKFLGLVADSTRHIVAIGNMSASTVPVLAERITLDSNTGVCSGGSSALNFFNIGDATVLNFVGVNSVSGPMRAVHCARASAITVQNFEINGTRNDAIRFETFSRLRIVTISAVQSTGTSIYLLTGSELEIGGANVESLSSVRAIALNDINIFTVANIKAKSPAGVIGVQVYANSYNGFVSNVISFGGATVAVKNDSPTTTVTNQMVVT